MNGATWQAELRYHGEWGVEAQILRQGELMIGRRFDTRPLAMQWAEEERAALAALRARPASRLASAGLPVVDVHQGCQTEARLLAGRDAAPGPGDSAPSKSESDSQTKGGS